jgi:hypothetical protein
MEWVAQVAAWSFTALGLIVFGAQVLAREVCYWLGRRHARHGDVPAEGVGIVVGAMLGLLAFVLALTLSFANTRFTERREGTLAEANAIGTAWLRAEAVGHPRGAAVARLLEDYTRERAAFVRAGLEPAAIDAATAHTAVLQTAIWGHVVALVRERPDPVAASLMAAVNEAFDASAAERFAFEARLPAQVFWLLMGMALLGMGCLGYQLGLRGRPLRALATLLTAMWTVVIMDILDLGAARLGSVRTGTAVYEWTIQGFQGGVPIPPMPEARR